MTPPVTTGRVVRSEWIKLRSVRASWLLLTAGVLAVAGLGLLVSYLYHAHWSTMSAAERASIDPANQSLIGVTLAQLLIGVLGVLVASGEYTTGMVRATFAAVPRRWPVLVAKAAVLGAATFATSVVAVFVAFAGGQALFGSAGVPLGSGHAVRAIVGAALYLTVVAVLGIGLGVLVRSTAAGIATLLAALLVAPVIVTVLPGSLGDTIGRYLPSTAGRAVFIDYGGDFGYSPWTGFGIFLLYAVAVLAAAGAVLRRRDA